MIVIYKFDKFRNASVFISTKSYRVLFTSYNCCLYQTENDWQRCGSLSSYHNDPLKKKKEIGVFDFVYL